MKKIKKLGILSFAFFQMTLFTLIGLLCGFIYSFGGALVDFLVSLGLASSIEMETPGLSTGTLLAFGALVGMPLIGALFGFISGIVSAILYNVFAKKFGAIKVDLLFEDESN